MAAARAAQGHIGRARRLARDASAAKRRADVLRVPAAVTSLGPALSAAATLVRTAEEEAKAVTEELDEPEREALRRAVIAADPEGADRRREDAERQAKVSLYPDPDTGTATLAGSRLPGVAAAAAFARLSALARAMKSSGAAGGIDLLRAQALIGLVLLPFNVHHLGQSAYGLWMLTASLTTYFSVLDLGFGET